MKAKSLVFSFAALSIAIASLPVHAQEEAYPSQPVTMVLGSSPGGANDILLRLIASRLELKWGQPVVVVNQPGASASVAAAGVAQAEPDGYTLDFINNNHTLSPSLMSLPYDPIADFDPIMRVGEAPQVLLLNNDALEARSLVELIDYARENPQAINFASCGPGCPTYLNMQVLMEDTGTEMVNVTYAGGGPAIAALLSGEVDLAWTSAGEAVSQLSGGSPVTALAVSTAVRSPNLPDVPTVAEAVGLADYDQGSWYGLLAPAGTPRAIVDQIYSDIAEVLEEPETMEFLASRDVAPRTLGPDEFKAFLSREIEIWAERIGRTN